MYLCMCDEKIEFACSILLWQATHRVVQASEFRRFKLLANLMDLNNGLL